MKTTNQIEASAPANVRPSSVSKHQMNRGLSTDAVLNCLRTKLPRSSASGFGSMCYQHGSRCWQRCFGLWAFTGISGAVSGSTRAAGSIRSAPIPPTRVPSIAPIFLPTFCPLEPMKNSLALSVKLSVKATTNSQKFWRLNLNSL